MTNYPKEWEVKKIKYLFDLSDDKNSLPLSEVQLLSLYTDLGVFPRGEHEEKGNKAANADGYMIVQPDDIVVNIILAWMGAIGISNYSGVTSPAYDIYRPRKDIVYPLFYHFLFRTTWFSGECYKYGRGIMAMRWRTYSSEFRSIVVPCPPLETQKKIIDFLDTKSKAIDTLITDKEKLLTLLAEERQAIISEAVTKGLDPHAEMKDSGVKWIGEIPVGWESVKLKYLVDLISDKCEHDGQTYIGLENVQSRTGKYIATENQEIDGLSTSFIENDVLYGKLRPYLAKCIVAKFDGICSGELLVLRNFKGEKYFLHYLLLSENMIDLVNSSTYGSKMPRANWTFISQVEIPLPPLEIQQQIVQYLDEKTSKIDQITADTKEQIKLLKEYRQSLISEVVTGKIEV